MQYSRHFIANVETRVNCENLRRITLPSTLKTIGRSAFGGCKNLERITFNGDAPTINGIEPKFNNVFGFNAIFDSDTESDLVITVKRGSKGWKEPGSTELPERWPATDHQPSRPIRFIDTLGK